jgi:hypothetical protein
MRTSKEFLLVAMIISPFIQPTVVSGITPEMLIEREENLGPVVAISRHKHIDEAISRANDSHYGLAAGCLRLALSGCRANLRPAWWGFQTAAWCR